SQTVRDGKAALIADICEGRLTGKPEIYLKLKELEELSAKPEVTIPRSEPTTMTPDLATLLENLAEDSQLDPVAERLTSSHTTPLLAEINRLPLKQETKLLASKLVQHELVDLRAHFRAGNISLKQYETGLKAIQKDLPALEKKLQQLELVEEKI